MSICICIYIYVYISRTLCPLAAPAVTWTVSIFGFRVCRGESIVSTCRPALPSPIQKNVLPHALCWYT